MRAKALTRGLPADSQAELEELILGQPEDIARVVAFVASDQGGWVNEQVVRANGGIV